MKIIQKWFELINYILVVAVLFWLSIRLENMIIIIFTILSVLFMLFSIYDFMDLLLPGNIFEILRLRDHRGVKRKIVVWIMSALFTYLLLNIAGVLISQSYKLLFQ